MLEAIKKLKSKLNDLQKKQSSYVTDSGMITNGYKYQTLMREINEIRTSLNWIEKLMKEGEHE